MLVLASLPSVKWSHRCSTRASPLFPPGRVLSHFLPCVRLAGHRLGVGRGGQLQATVPAQGPLPRSTGVLSLMNRRVGGLATGKLEFVHINSKKNTRLGMTYAGASTSDKWTQGDGRQASPAHSGKLVYDVPAEPRPAPLTPRPTQNLFLPMEPSEQGALSHHLDRGVILHF